MNNNIRYNVARLLLMLVALLRTAPLFADALVDTGPGSSRIPSRGSSLQGVSDERFRFQAGRIVLNQPAHIDSIEGWLYVVQSGLVVVKVYNDGGVVPGKTMLFEKTFESSSVDIPHWEVFSGLDWNLDPGAYWLAFEPTIPSSLEAYMPYGAANPLTGYARFDAVRINGRRAEWYVELSANSGFRVNGTYSQTSNVDPTANEPLSLPPSITCKAAGCALPIACNRLQVCGFQIDIFFRRLPGLRQKDSVAAAARPLARIATGSTVVEPGKTASVTLELTTLGKKIVRQRRRNKIKAIVEVRNTAEATLQMQSIKVRLR